MQARKEGNQYLEYKNLFRLVDPFAVDADPTNDHLVAYRYVDVPPDYPEISTTGVSTWFAYHPDPNHLFWRATRVGHWLFEGTNLADGDTFGSAVPLQIFDGTNARWTNGMPFVHDHATYGIPESSLILATIPTPDARPWMCEALNFESDPSCFVPGTAAIVIHDKPGGGVVLVIPDKRWMAFVPSDGVLTKIIDNAFVKFADPAPFDPFAGYSYSDATPVPWGGDPSGPCRTRRHRFDDASAAAPPESVGRLPPPSSTARRRIGVLSSVLCTTCKYRYDNQVPVEA